MGLSRQSRWWPLSYGWYGDDDVKVNLFGKVECNGRERVVNHNGSMTYRGESANWIWGRVLHEIQAAILNTGFLSSR